MTIDIKKHVIPAEITEKGGVRVQLVNKQTVALSTTIKEAKDGLYTLGDAQFIQGTFEGLVKSMAKGVERDGHSRQLGDFITFYAQPTGPIDIDKGWDETKNAMVLKARLLNRMVLDTKNWTFNDVTPGKDTFSINYITTGEKGGGVTLGRGVHVNGREFPAVDKLTVEWAVEGTDKHGTVPTESLSGSCDRIDIAADAFDEVKSAAYDGKTLTLTVRGNFLKASKSATLKYVAPPEPAVTSVKQGELAEGSVGFDNGKLTITGVSLSNVTKAEIRGTIGGEPAVNDITADLTFGSDTVIESGESGFQNRSGLDDSEWQGQEVELVLKRGNTPLVTYPLSFVA